MDLDLDEPDCRNSSFFGIPRTRNVKESPSIDPMSDATVWDIFDNHARKVEREHIKDWNDTLGTLLVFVRCCPKPYIQPLMMISGSIILRSSYGIHQREYGTLTRGPF